MAKSPEETAKRIAASIQKGMDRAGDIAMPQIIGKAVLAIREAGQELTWDALMAEIEHGHLDSDMMAEWRAKALSRLRLAD